MKGRPHRRGALKEVTGKDFQLDREAWKTWWDRNRQDFRKLKKKDQ